MGIGKIAGKVGGGAKGFLSAVPYKTRGEAIGMAAGTGIAVGTTNSIISKNYVEKGRQHYRNRRMTGKHGISRKGGV